MNITTPKILLTTRSCMPSVETCHSHVWTLLYAIQVLFSYNYAPLSTSRLSHYHPVDRCGGALLHLRPLLLAGCVPGAAVPTDRGTHAQVLPGGVQRHHPCLRPDRCVHLHSHLPSEGLRGDRCCQIRLPRSPPYPPCHGPTTLMSTSPLETWSRER